MKGFLVFLTLFFPAVSSRLLPWVDIPQLSSLFPAMSQSVLAQQDTPQFYLVSSSKYRETDLHPVRFKNSTGGTATLTGTHPFIVFYFSQGKLVAVPPGGTGILNSFVNAVPQVSCSTWGTLFLFNGSSTNKCLTPGKFQLQSNEKDSQLGAFLTNNFTGGFFACGSAHDIYYKADNTGPPGLTCTPLRLYTVPLI